MLLLCLLFDLAGASGAEKLKGRLGWFTIFKVKTNLSFVSISWSKIVGSKSENIALVTFGEPCGLLVPLPAFEKRVNISKDCRKLYLDQLEKEDAGRYTAEIISQSNTVVNESFDLSVYSKYPSGQAKWVPVWGGSWRERQVGFEAGISRATSLWTSGGTGWTHKLFGGKSRSYLKC